MQNCTDSCWPKPTEKSNCACNAPNQTWSGELGLRAINVFLMRWCAGKLEAAHSLTSDQRRVGAKHSPLAFWHDDLQIDFLTFLCNKMRWKTPRIKIGTYLPGKLENFKNMCLVKFRVVSREFWISRLANYTANRYLSI